MIRIKIPEEKAFKMKKEILNPKEKAIIWLLDNGKFERIKEKEKIGDFSE